jgi:hypothetical protein
VRQFRCFDIGSNTDINLGSVLLHGNMGVGGTLSKVVDVEIVSGRLMMNAFLLWSHRFSNQWGYERGR